MPDKNSLGLTLTVIWYHLFAFLLIFSGIITFFFGGISSVSAPYFGIIFFVVGVFAVFMAHSLSKKKHWAKTTSIILSLIFVILTLWFYIYQPLTAMIIIIPNILAAIYLLFSKEVKKAFS